MEKTIKDGKIEIRINISMILKDQKKGEKWEKEADHCTEKTPSHVY